MERGLSLALEAEKADKKGTEFLKSRSVHERSGYQYLITTAQSCAMVVGEGLSRIDFCQVVYCDFMCSP